MPLLQLQEHLRTLIARNQLTLTETTVGSSKLTSYLITLPDQRIVLTDVRMELQGTATTQAQTLTLQGNMATYWPVSGVSNGRITLRAATVKFIETAPDSSQFETTLNVIGSLLFDRVEREVHGTLQKKDLMVFTLVIAGMTTPYSLLALASLMGQPGRTEEEVLEQFPLGRLGTERGVLRELSVTCGFGATPSTTCRAVLNLPTEWTLVPGIVVRQAQATLHSTTRLLRPEKRRYSTGGSINGVLTLVGQGFPLYFPLLARVYDEVEVRAGEFELPGIPAFLRVFRDEATAVRLRIALQRAHLEDIRVEIARVTFDRAEGQHLCFLGLEGVLPLLGARLYMFAQLTRRGFQVSGRLMEDETVDVNALAHYYQPTAPILPSALVNEMLLYTQPVEGLLSVSALLADSLAVGPLKLLQASLEITRDSTGTLVSLTALLHFARISFTVIAVPRFGNTGWLATAHAPENATMDLHVLLAAISEAFHLRLPGHENAQVGNVTLQFALDGSSYRFSYALPTSPHAVENVVLESANTYAAIASWARPEPLHTHTSVSLPGSPVGSLESEEIVYGTPDFGSFDDLSWVPQSPESEDSIPGSLERVVPNVETRTGGGKRKDRDFLQESQQEKAQRKDEVEKDKG
jgi:hypothetical protein